MATSQHRCVFVGNIPYDATEEQLVQICEEVGPVVSFRLVIDRETGKPKGYGFCEYKDEETALSARRNLQGYEINGRQLRVDFAENDKGADRNREQGRGGPGMAANVEPQKQVGGPAILGDAALHQPVGLPLAMAASSVMAGALGGAQAGSKSNQNGFQSQPMLGSDPLTLHLAKMSRNQLNEVISDLKVMATKNKELARQLLLASPQLPKALFQAQILLGMVTPQVLQMPNIRQASVPLTQPVVQDGQLGQQLAVQSLTGLPPLAQNRMQVGLMPKVQEGQVTAMTHKSSIHSQFSALPQPPAQPQIQLAPHGHNQALQQATFSGQSGVAALPSIRPQLPNNLPVRQQIQVASSSSLKQQMQPPLLQHPGKIGSANLGHNSQLAIPNTTLQPTAMTHPSFPDPGFQPGSSTFSSISETVNNNADRSSQVTNNTYSNMPSGLSMKKSLARDTSEPMNHPSKLVKLEDGRRAPLSTGSLNLSTSSASGPSQALGIGSASANQISKADEKQPMEKVSQLQLPPEVESALLQQVLNLTPEQLSSLPPEQQQEVIQLQQMLR